MQQMTIADAQADMCAGYLDGAPGIAVSGIVWALAAIASLRSPSLAVLALLIGGTAIYPVSVLLAKLLGRAGAHASGNPLGRLALEGTAWMLAGIALAYGMFVLRTDWFFPAMLLVIGGRYFTFQTLYGLRVYWVLGALLCVAGLLFGMLRAPPTVSATAGAAIELAFAFAVFVIARRHGDRR